MKLVFICIDRCLCYYEDYFRSIRYCLKENCSNIEMDIFLYPEKQLHIVRKRINKSAIGEVFILIKDICININDKPFNLNSNKKVYLLNTEQLTRKKYYKIAEHFSKIYPMIDYSLSNIALMNNKNIMCLPYQVNANEIKNYHKIHDVAILGYMTNYRWKVFNDIKAKGIQINCTNGWNETRDNVLFRHKILLNVHFKPSCKIFEEIRCNRCIVNKMIVITERNVYLDPFLKPYVVECDYKDLAETVKNTIDNYDKIYEKIYGNFDIDKFAKHYSNFIRDFIECNKN